MDTQDRAVAGGREMTCKTCAYFDDENDWCTHPKINTECDWARIKWGCNWRKEIEE